MAYQTRGLQVFKEIAAYARMPAVELSHSQRVTRIYRRALRLQGDYIIDYDDLISESYKLRARFDAKKNIPANSPETEYWIMKAEQELDSHVHPEPYVKPWMPGGSKFMRNSPPITPEHHYTGTETPVWPDMIPITFRPHTGSIPSLLVDFGKKNME
jgi:NADH dehydrogenase (ubiquinone) 1 beta subcomplex subunit 9